MIDRLIGEADFEHILKSWIFLENHDTARLANAVPDPDARRLAQVLQFTLPGAPNLYYGCEVGMVGGDDPEMRAPMRWDLVTEDNPTLAWTRQLIDLHQTHRALRVGQFRTLTTDRLIGYERHTDRIADSVFVLANPCSEEVTEWVQLPNSKLMNPVLDAGPARRCRRAADERDAARHPAGRRVRRARHRRSTPRAATPRTSGCGSHRRLPGPGQIGSGLRCRSVISRTFATRRRYFSSSRKSVAIHTRTISWARAEPMIFPPRHRTFVSECERASSAQNGSWHTAAYTPCTRLAIIALP